MNAKRNCTFVSDDSRTSRVQHERDVERQRRDLIRRLARRVAVSMSNGGTGRNAPKGGAGK
jgi:hypothetical protein